MIKFKKFLGNTLIGKRPIEYRVSIQTNPPPTALCISTNAPNSNLIVIAFDDWLKIVSSVEALKQEAYH